MKTRFDVLIVFILINFTAILVQSDSKESCPKPVKNEIEAPTEEIVEEQSERSCRKIRDPEQASIVIKGTEGRLGNMIFTYMNLLSVKLKFGVEVYTTEKRRKQMSDIFDENALEIKAAEDHVCGFREDFQHFWDILYEKKIERIANQVRKVLNQPDLEFGRNENGKILIPGEYYRDPRFGIDRIVHTKEFDLFESYPWQPEHWTIFDQLNISLLEENGLIKGKTVLLYSNNVYLDFMLKTEGLDEHLAKNLKVKDEYKIMAEKTMKEVVEKHLSKIKSKKKRKKLKDELIFVGIHIRKGDHVALEIEKKVPVLKASFFHEAMELYRSKYGSKVIFVLITDDLDWCEKHLTGRRKIEDLYIVSEPLTAGIDGIGHDLAVMSMCDHAILSRGTFSFWAGFLAGGSVILPCHIPQYRADFDNIVVCRRDPLKNPLPRLYAYTI